MQETLTCPENESSAYVQWRRVLDLEKRGSPIGKADIVVGANWVTLGGLGYPCFLLTHAAASRMGQPWLSRRGGSGAWALLESP